MFSRGAKAAAAELETEEGSRKCPEEDLVGAMSKKLRPHPPNQAASVGTGKTEEETEQCGKESNKYNQKVHHVNSNGPTRDPHTRSSTKRQFAQLLRSARYDTESKNGHRTLYLHAPRGHCAQ